MAPISKKGNQVRINRMGLLGRLAILGHLKCPLILFDRNPKEIELLPVQFHRPLQLP